MDTFLKGMLWVTAGCGFQDEEVSNVMCLEVTNTKHAVAWIDAGRRTLQRASNRDASKYMKFRYGSIDVVYDPPRPVQDGGSEGGSRVPP